MYKKRVSATLRVLLTAVVSLVCKAQGPNSSAIRVGYLPATHDTLLFIALEERLFPSNLRVEPHRYSNSAEVLQHLAAGDIDLGIPGIAAPARYIGSGAEFLIVGGAATKSAALVARQELAKEFPDYPNRKLTDDEIRQFFVKLRGRRVGTVVQSTGDSIFRSAIPKEWMRQIIIQTKNSPSEILTDLQAGSLDAGVLWSPHMTRAENSGMKIVLWMYQILPEHVCCRMVCAQEFAKKNPESLSAFLAGILKANERFQLEGHREIMRTVNKYLSPALADADLELELFGDRVRGIPPRTSISPDLYEKGVDEYLKRMEEAQILTKEQRERVRGNVVRTYLVRAYNLVFPRLSDNEADKCARDGYKVCSDSFLR